MQFLSRFVLIQIVGSVGTMSALAPLVFAQDGAEAPAPPSPDMSVLLRPLRTAPKPSEKAADGSPVPQTMTTPSGKTMALQFHDEFDAVADVKTDGRPYIDRRKWQTTFWQGSSIRTLGSNAEAQYYMDKDYAGRDNLPLEKRPNPFSFEKPGILTISATKTPKELWGNYWMGEQRPFSSGLLISDKKFVFQYGYVEGRFKLPANRGAWPAFWMLPNNPARSTDEAKNHPWPPEIDIFEAFGHSPNKFTTNIIAPKTEKVRLSKFAHDMGQDLTQDFHTWGLEWDAENVVYYFDGKEIARAAITNSFRQPMYLLVNLAVGGNWYADEMKNAKTPYKAWEVDETTMPWKMECDYIRVYQSPDNLFPPSYVPPPKKPGETPTPYPDPKNEAAWPGQGPIRAFDWMTQNREAFWSAREKDQNAVVFVGDSLTGGWKPEFLAQEFPGLKVVNRGIGGDVSRGLLFRFKEDVLDLKPKAIVLLVGTNDLSAYGNPAGVEANIAALIKQAREANPNVPIVLCQIPPRDVKDAPVKPGALADLNARIARLGDPAKNVVVLDLFTPLATPDGMPREEFFGKDRIHLAPPAYKVWADLIRPVFAQLGVSATSPVPTAPAATTPTLPNPGAAAPLVPVAALKPADGPTPFPGANNEAAWPGQGPIRVFGWMTQNRGWFWKARERDQGAVVFAGSSSIAGWKIEDMAKAFPNLKVANRGIGGDVSRGLLFRFKEDVLDLKPKAIVLLIGGNDLSTLSDPAVVEHNLRLMIEMARAQNPKVPIVLCQLAPRDNPEAPTKPGAVADLNARIAKLGTQYENTAIIDLFTPFATPEGMPKEEFFGKDRMHFRPAAYKIWADLLQPAFEKLGVK